MMGQRGSSTVLILAVLAALLVAATTIGVMAQGQVAALKAQTAADAAALAAAPATFLGDDPVGLAGDFAAANGAELIDCDCQVDPTWQTRLAKVTVRVPLSVWLVKPVHVTRTATAEFAPVALITGSP